MSNIDQQFVEYVVKSLVGNPEAVVVDRRVDEKGVLLELTVDPDDLGRVIGKRGATAQSLRTLLRALGTKNEARYNLKIIDNGVGDHRRDDHRDDAGQAPTQQTDDQPAAAPVPATDDVAADNAPQPEEAPVAEPVANVVVETPAEASSDSSDRLAQTRRELADLDDLDV